MLIAIALTIIPLFVNSIPAAIIHNGSLSFHTVNVIYSLMRILNFFAYTAFGISLFIFVKKDIVPELKVR